MVEAVTSSVSNASLVRATAEQANIARSAAVAASKNIEVVQAPFVSPYIHVDNESNTVVLQIRNCETGKVIDQIPAKASSEEDRTRTQAPAQQAQPQQAQTQQIQQQAPAASTASFGAFAKQVASLQSAVSGGGNGATVSLFA